MYAVFASGGKQFKVQEQDVVTMERVAGEAGAKVTFTEVLAVGEGADLKLGTPFVEGAKVEGEIVEQTDRIQDETAQRLPPPQRSQTGTHQGENHLHCLIGVSYEIRFQRSFAFHLDPRIA